MNSIEIFQVDAFTDKPFSGNPAGVCVNEHEIETPLMQNIAREMNLSETAFICPKDGFYEIRFFTPTQEIDLCGHATLSSAHILWEHANIRGPITFKGRKDRLVASKKDQWIVLDFPAKPVDESGDVMVAQALGVDATYIGQNEEFHLLEMENEKTIYNISPDFDALSKVTNFGAIVTAQSDEGLYDCISRCFFPNIGINEDPATGLAHCSLGPYWSGKLQKDFILALQASTRRGVLKVSSHQNRVTLHGKAITMMKCNLINY